MAYCSHSGCSCKNLYTDWAIGNRSGPCEDCHHPKTDHTRAAVATDASASAGTKRGYDEALQKAIQTLFPDPLAAECGTHVSLMSQVLGTFCDNARTVGLDSGDYAFTVKFCDALCGAFISEGWRQAAACELLTEYFNLPIVRLPGKVDGWRKDGILLAVCGGNGAHTAPTLLIKCTNELCSPQSAAEEQDVKNYLKLLSESDFVRTRSVCPALLMTIAGRYVGFCAAVHAKGLRVDPVVPLLPLMLLKQDKRMMAALARALKAAKLCVQQLQVHYNTLSAAVPSAQEVNQLRYPYPRSFEFEGSTVPFAYDRQLGDKLLFEAHVSQGVADLSPGQKIIVKYTDSYGKEAHEQCYAYEQSAPRLFAHTVLANGWHMVVMEHLAGEDFCPGRETPAVEERLKRVVQHLHANGFVHGDLRYNNIRVVDDRVCLLDFDWSGRAGMHRYPCFMNHIDIDWPQGASDGQPLQYEHDYVWLNRIV